MVGEHELRRRILRIGLDRPDELDHDAHPTNMAPPARQRIILPMNKLIWITIVIALAACSKKSDDAAKGGAAGGAAGGGAASACANAAGKAVAGLGAGMGGNGVAEKLQTILTTRCTEDKWPPDVIKCYESANGMAGMKTCRGKLAPELGQKLLTEITGAMAGAAGMMGRPPAGHPGGDPPAPAAPAAPAEPPK